MKFKCTSLFAINTPASRLCIWHIYSNPVAKVMAEIFSLHKIIFHSIYSETMNSSGNFPVTVSITVAVISTTSQLCFYSLCTLFWYLFMVLISGFKCLSFFMSLMLINFILLYIYIYTHILHTHIIYTYCMVLLLFWLK